MSFTFNPGIQSQENIEVHKYYTGTIAGAAILAIVLQAFLHKYGHWSEFVELPLLVTIYFGVSRRNPASGLLLGAFIGILQDALSHDNAIGLYGIAKTFVGYVASSVGARIDMEHPVSRFALIVVLFHFHQIVLALTSRTLLNRAAPFFDLHSLIASLISGGFGVLLFALLDRLRRPA
ncbi:MAG TPA: rod shape-determining protein MreD [Candidatus Acidoferrales bacterium]|nr:rod shape-determining protein MreD [Candidatus Acidoferrales bacterium]